MKKNPNDNLSEIDKRRLEEYKKKPQANLKENIDERKALILVTLVG